MSPQIDGKLVYLRTAVSVDPKGWAKFDYIKMPEYRWGILLAPHEEDRKVPFGQHLGSSGEPFVLVHVASISHVQCTYINLEDRSSQP